MVVEDFDECLGECFPRTARYVVLAKATGQLVKISTRAVAALPQQMLESRLISIDFGYFRGGKAGHFHEVWICSTGVDVVLAAAFVADQSFGFEQR